MATASSQRAFSRNRNSAENLLTQDDQAYVYRNAIDLVSDPPVLSSQQHITTHNTHDSSKNPKSNHTKKHSSSKGKKKKTRKSSKSSAGARVVTVTSQSRSGHSRSPSGKPMSNHSQKSKSRKRQIVNAENPKSIMSSFGFSMSRSKEGSPDQQRIGSGSKSRQGDSLGRRVQFKGSA